MLRKKLDQYGTLITYASMLGHWPRVEDLLDRLRLLNRTDVILRIAWCSAVTRSWATTGDNSTDTRVRTHLFPFWKEQFDTWTAIFGEGFVFSRYTLLWLMRQAFSTCPTDGNRLNTGEGLRVFGEACLIANDLAAFTTPKPLSTDLAVAANFIPQTEYFSQEDYDRDIARTLYLLTDLAPRSLGTVLPAFAERLQGLLGYDVTRYCDLAFASAMKPLAAQTEGVENYRVVTIAPANFATTTIPVETAEQFLNSMAAGEQDFRDKIVDDDGYASDFTVFRERPFLRREADLVPLDLGFVLDKAGRSLFWTALKNCPEGERETLLRQWGHLFESYVHAILSGVGTPGSTLFDGPRLVKKLMRPFGSST